MEIMYSPIVMDGPQYLIDDETLYLKNADQIIRFDFSKLTDGEMVDCSAEYILSAKRIKGQLEVLLMQPVDSEGNPVEQDSFSIDQYIDGEIIWKTQEEIEDEQNAPKPLTESEILMLAVAELDVQREQDKIETQLAIAELAETLLGGGE